MQPNKTKAKMLAGQPAFGYIFGFPATGLVETAGQAGMDFVVIDCEHGPMSEETAEQMVRAAEVGGVTPLVRVPANRSEVILRFMDRGAAGVIVPHVNTRADAQAAVEAVKYHPMGKRGFAGGRWTIGIQANPHEFANRETLVLCMVEEQEGVDNIGDILSVPGLDGIHIGPADLSQALGLPGQTTQPAVLEVVHRLIITTVAHGKIAGVGSTRVSDPAGVQANIALGAGFFTLPPGSLLQLATQQFLSQVLKT